MQNLFSRVEPCDCCGAVLERVGILTRPVADFLLELQQLGEVLLQRRLRGVHIDIHVARW